MSRRKGMQRRRRSSSNTKLARALESSSQPAEHTSVSHDCSVGLGCNFAIGNILPRGNGSPLDGLRPETPYSPKRWLTIVFLLGCCDRNVVDSKRASARHPYSSWAVPSCLAHVVRGTICFLARHWKEEVDVDR
eukprot:6808969-Pyramimonas_sp.AAC.1